MLKPKPVPLPRMVVESAGIRTLTRLPTIEQVPSPLACTMYGQYQDEIVWFPKKFSVINFGRGRYESLAKIVFDIGALEGVEFLSLSQGPIISSDSYRPQRGIDRIGQSLIRINWDIPNSYSINFYLTHYIEKTNEFVGYFNAVDPLNVKRHASYRVSCHSDHVKFSGD